MSQRVSDDGIVKLTRGDDGVLEIDLELVDQYGNKVGDYELNDGDILTFTLKKTAKENDTDILIQKKIQGSNIFSFVPSDTANLSFKKYFYDVEIKTVTGKTYTVVDPTIFEITSEVGF